MDRDTKIGIALYIVTLIIIIFLFIATGIAGLRFNSCATGQSINCLQFACRQADPVCGNYAMRVDSEGNVYCSNAPESPVSQGQ